MIPVCDGVCTYNIQDAFDLCIGSPSCFGVSEKLNGQFCLNECDTESEYESGAKYYACKSRTTFTYKSRDIRANYDLDMSFDSSPSTGFCDKYFTTSEIFEGNKVTNSQNKTLVIPKS